MKIEVWFDIACPYSYIGLKHLEKAIEFYAGGQPTVLLRSFELEPEIAVDNDETQCATLMRQYKLSQLRAQQTINAIMMAGQKAGLTIDFDKVIRTNTFDAHRLIHFAADNGKGAEMAGRLFKAYFEEGKRIGNKKQLIGLAAEIGIDAKQLLESNSYSAEVRADEHLAQRIGIGKVPFFWFEEKYSITGAQSITVFTELMSRIKAADDNR
ncbi:DsbA family oxidoreductase [Mucilaginibacter gossypiicola]|uniref:DsbA family oxidoreductase n=1 Tax=Mucilaginibacter gossypiicola TaxID=551995 RepID=UPI0014311ACF|nr:DsbA family oxidoreductase [Mucilaginibacter gossypiicola]